MRTYAWSFVDIAGNVSNVTASPGQWDSLPVVYRALRQLTRIPSAELHVTRVSFTPSVMWEAYRIDWVTNQSELIGYLSFD